MSLNIGWSAQGGLSLGISGGVGFENAASVGLSIGFGAKYGNFSISINGGLGGAYAYAGYDTKGGWMAGAGYSFTSLYSMFSPVSFSTNMLSAGIDYSENGGYSANAGGFSYGSCGLSINPSIGASLEFRFGTQYFKAKNNIHLDPNDKSGKPDVPYGDNEGINKKADSWFKRPKTLETIHADGTGSGLGDQKDGSYVYGKTVWHGLKSTVYLSEGAFMSNAFLYMTIQHEYVHVYLNQSGFKDNNYLDAQEVAAWYISYQQAKQWNLDSYARDFSGARSDYKKQNIINNGYYPEVFNNFNLNSTIRITMPK